MTVMACVVKNCKSHRGIKGRDGKFISFHRFPTEKKILDQWILAAAREPDWTPKSHNTICSEHFTSSCFNHIYIHSKHRKLTDWAIPTLKLPHEYVKNEEPISNSGCYPTLLIMPLALKCTAPQSPLVFGKDVGMSPTSYPSKVKPSEAKIPPLTNGKKSDCNQCQQYRGKIQGLKRKIEHLKELAHKRLMRNNALRQKVKHLEVKHTLRNKLDNNKHTL